jgi:hypothetical protein
MSRAKRIRPPKQRFPISCDHNGTRIDFVDKTAAELVQELHKLRQSVESAKSLARFVRRLRHPSIRAFCTHIQLLNVQTSHPDIDAAVAEACRVNKEIIIGLELLQALTHSKIEPLERLRFHMTYAGSHRKRDFQQGWNGNKIEVTHEEQAVEH